MICVVSLNPLNDSSSGLYCTNIGFIMNRFFFSFDFYLEETCLSSLLSHALCDGAVHVYLNSLPFKSQSNAAGWTGMFQTFTHRTASVSSVKRTFIWLCTAECMSMLFSLLLLSDEPNRSTRGVVCFCLHSLRPGLSASLPRGQTQVVMIKAELLTPILKNEMAYCIATDSGHNEP